MPAKLIDGNQLAARTKDDVKNRVGEILRSGRAVHLAAILVGQTPAGELYAQRQGEACRAVGINYELITLPADSAFERVAGTIEKLNHDPSVTPSAPKFSSSPSANPISSPPITFAKAPSSSTSASTASPRPMEPKKP